MPALGLTVLVLALAYCALALETPILLDSESAIGEPFASTDASAAGSGTGPLPTPVDLIKPLPNLKAANDALTVGLKRRACRDRTKKCRSWGTKFCARRFYWKRKPVGTHWCPKTCSKCPGPSSPPQASPPPLSPNLPLPSPPLPSPSTPLPSPSSPPPFPTSGWQSELLALVNQARAQNGVGPLCLNSQLTAAAQLHSQDQANTHRMDHIGSDGSTPATRVTGQGYIWSAVGENVAWNQQSVQEVFDDWMNSPGHRANILNAWYMHMGAGVAYSDGPYWTQVFGASSSQGCT